MMSCHQLEAYSSIPFNHSTLLSMLKEYRRPNDKISRMLSSGEIVQIKRGLYLLGETFRTEQISQPLVANLLYGPSYVSSDFALAYYGIIPEAVFEVSSMVVGRARAFDTPFGRFSYIHSYSSLYPIGIQIHSNTDGSCFLMASPEKALCDKIIFTKKLKATSVKSMMAFLIEDLRIDQTYLNKLDTAIIEQCLLTGYKKSQLYSLYKLIGKLK